MRRIVARIHFVLVWIVLSGLVIEVYLAGVGLFGADSLDMHRMVGMSISLPMLLLLLLALVGRLGRRLIGLSTLLIALTVIQAMLPDLRTDAPWVAALHPVNAFVLTGISVLVVREARWSVVERPHVSEDQATVEASPARNVRA